MNPVAVAGISLAAVLCLSFLRGISSELSTILIIASMALLFLLLFDPFREIISAISDLSRAADLSDASLSVVFRGLGIALLTRFASGVCIDCGQRALGATVDYCGQIALALLALPLVSDLVETISEVS